MENAIITIIKDLGFPIAVSLFFMFKVDKTIQANTKVMEEVCITMQSCKK